MKRNLSGVLKTAFPHLTDADIRAGAGRVIRSVREHRRHVVEVISQPRRKMVCGEVGASIRGEIEVSVVDGKTGEVVRKYPKQKNLILNRFMEDLYSRAYNAMFTNAVASTSTTPLTAFDSGTSTASQTGTTVSMISGTFTFDDTFNQSSSNVGNVIKWDSGEERRIISRTNATTVEVTSVPTANVAAGEFTVYGTNQTRMADLVNEERTTTYLTGAGNCGTSSNGTTGEISLFRTFDFPIRVNNDRSLINTPYKEIGFSNSSSVGSSTINSRIILASPVGVDSGQQLRVKYILIVTISPITPETIASNPITGWTSAGKQMIQVPMLEQINTSGAGTGLVGASPIEPWDVTGGGTAGTVCFSLSQSTAAHIPPSGGVFQNGPDRSGTATALDHDTSIGKTAQQLYSAASEVHKLTLDKQAGYAASVGNSPAGGWGSLALGVFQFTSGCLTPTRQAFVYVLNSAQVKDSLHSLDVAVRFTWSRVLS